MQRVGWKQIKLQHLHVATLLFCFLSLSWKRLFCALSWQDARPLLRHLGTLQNVEVCSQAVQVVGEGYDGPENPPIDVHDYKLLGLWCEGSILQCLVCN